MHRSTSTLERVDQLGEVHLGARLVGDLAGDALDVVVALERPQAVDRCVA